MKRITQKWLVAVLLAASAAAGAAQSATSRGVNVVDLLKHSDEIVTGLVESVTDGIDEEGVPYTEVTFKVQEAILGNASETMTFRQFGLVSPRDMGNGRTMLPGPAGFPTFAEGQELLIFLGKPASMTGLRTAVGLGHGKFSLGAGNAENEYANEGLFDDVSILAENVTANDERLLVTTRGPVSAETLLGFVRRAVDERWVSSGEIWRTSEGQPKGGSNTGGGGPKKVFEPRQ
jgi:hypothetical protein